MQPSSDQRFRPDIEGLRALAVTLVVASHAGVPGLAGGFAGVDIFFVISGFLITRLLHAEWERTGGIDILAFYARRIRRLLPAFALLLIVTLLAIRTLYSPIEQPQWLASGLAATLYYSNLHYAAGYVDYMQPAAKQDPFLHTWSLGVEEQFYLLWPLLLLLAGALARRWRGHDAWAWVLGSLLLASLALSVYLTSVRQPLAFFLPVTRAWEFGAGALVALYAPLFRGRSTSPARAGLLSLAGLLMLLASAVVFTERTPFPGVAALLPVTGTALVILFLPVAAPGAIAGRLLALPLLQWLGRLSYGWYLWHWPLLVMAKVVLPEPGLGLRLALAGAALAMAQASYSLVEHPVRTRPLFQRLLPTYALAAVVAIVGSGMLWLSSRAAEAQAQTPAFRQLKAASKDIPILYTSGCDGWVYNTVLIECNAGDPGADRVMVLLGDSHAGQWFASADSIARHFGLRLIVMTKSACPIVDQDYFYARLGRVFTECRRWKERVRERIAALRPALLIVANSERYDFTPQQWRDGLDRLLPALADASGHLVVLRDTPNPGFSAPECLARQEWSPALPMRPCSFDAAASLSPAVLDAYRVVVSRRPNMALVDMTAHICREAPCQARIGDLVKFRDGNHLSNTFAGLLAEPLARELARAGAL